MVRRATRSGRSRKASWVDELRIATLTIEELRVERVQPEMSGFRQLVANSRPDQPGGARLPRSKIRWPAVAIAGDITSRAQESPTAPTRPPTGSPIGSPRAASPPGWGPSSAGYITSRAPAAICGRAVRCDPGEPRLDRDPSNDLRIGRGRFPHRDRARAGDETAGPISSDDRQTGNGPSGTDRAADRSARGSRDVTAQCGTGVRDGSGGFRDGLNPPAIRPCGSLQ